MTRFCAGVAMSDDAVYFVFEPHVPMGAAEQSLNRTMFAVEGRGGMGVVHHALDVQLNRPVALKMLSAGAWVERAAVERFNLEAKTIARLRHPGIVAIYDVGFQDGLPFLALEYCAGGSLAQRFAGRPQSPKVAATTILALARAIQVAHEAGIVHRDLKPSNVLIAKAGTATPAPAELKITDFGLAKLADAGTSRAPTVRNLPAPAVGMSVSADGTRLALALNNNTVQVFSLETGKAVGRVLEHNGPVVGVSLSPDGRRLVTGCGDNAARLWDVDSGLPLSPPMVYPYFVRHLPVCPRKTRFVTSCDGSDLHIRAMPRPLPDGDPRRLSDWLALRTGLSVTPTGTNRLNARALTEVLTRR